MLAGQIRSHSTVSSVSLELRRSYRGRCSAYNGTSERFVQAPCGSGTAFRASNSERASPTCCPLALGPGRYVLDVAATDTAGNTVALARG